ncbi:NADH-quinone oxidoreductase subunit C [Helicobacter sp. MIT 14-3879]|uniref:NADH-quinone oxidoreductase subunit C n=1 Tax=Helicobacter sp. MIT 14-3879 TaxID=2040649 RepID=UPI000E1EAADD|nr:NADH-quinone oxidoreductase subunit C [Helicobacter sp. MIT 14-3879]RDU63937.1 NADH-quinone oxidoreductase subunit C [Helicobacter sp. MIT 14-3879]
MKNIQKKVYHKNRFYKTKETKKEEVKDSKFDGILKVVEARIKVLKSYIEFNNLVFYIAKDDIIECLITLKEYGFDILSEMSAIHLEDDSFEIFYQLLSMERRFRVRVKSNTKDNIDSISHVFRNATWCEREAYDMFGIKFNNHPYLKRLLMPDDWSGHPLRKDYPLQGDEDAKWYEIDKIFGEEYRINVGEEQRDSFFINQDDTFNFAHIGYEVPKGEPPKEIESNISYQENSGIFVITKFDKQKQLTKRR